MAARFPWLFAVSAETSFDPFSSPGKIEWPDSRDINDGVDHDASIRTMRGSPPLLRGILGLSMRTVSILGSHQKREISFLKRSGDRDDCWEKKNTVSARRHSALCASRKFLFPIDVGGDVLLNIRGTSVRNGARIFRLDDLDFPQKNLTRASVNA